MATLLALALLGAAPGASLAAREYGRRSARLRHAAPRVFACTHSRSVVEVLSPCRPQPLPYEDAVWWLASVPLLAAMLLPLAAMSALDWWLEGYSVLLYVVEVSAIAAGLALLLDSRYPEEPIQQEITGTDPCRELEAAAESSLVRWASRIRQHEIARDAKAGLALVGVAAVGLIGCWLLGSSGEAGTLLGLAAAYTLPIAAASTFVYHSATLRRSTSDPLLFVALRSVDHRCAVPGPLACDGHTAKWAWTSLAAIGVGAFGFWEGRASLDGLPGWLAMLGVWVVNFSLPPLLNAFVWEWRSARGQEPRVEPDGPTDIGARTAGG